MEIFELLGHVKIDNTKALESIKVLKEAMIDLGETTSKINTSFSGVNSVISKSMKVALDATNKQEKSLIKVTDASDSFLDVSKKVSKATSKTKTNVKLAAEANDAFEKSSDKASKKAKKFVDGLKSIVSFSSSAIGVVGNVGKTLVDAGSNFSGVTSTIESMSDSLGMSTKGYQEWAFIAKQSGGSVEALQSGMAQLKIAAGELESGIGLGAESFKKLGLSSHSLSGMSNQEMLEATLVALQGVSDETERASLANQLFGESSANLGDVLALNGDAIESLKTQAGELGVILGEDAINSGACFQESMGLIELSVQGVGMSLMASLMPSIQEFLDFIVANMPIIQQTMTDVFSIIGQMLAGLVPIFTDLGSQLLPIILELFTNLSSVVLPPIMDIIYQMVNTVFPQLLDTFTILIESIFPPIMDVLRVMFEDIIPPIMEQLIEVIESIMPPLNELFQSLSDNILPVLVEVFTSIIESVMPPLMELFGIFNESILPPLIELFNTLAITVIPLIAEKFLWISKAVLPVFTAVFETMVPMIEGSMKMLSGIIKVVTGLIKGDWESVWSGILEFFDGVMQKILGVVDGFSEVFAKSFQGISDIVLGIWDGTMNGIKDAINFIIGGINSFIRYINDMTIPDWVPAVGGLGFSMSEIPLLAQGGNITRSGRVIVGEEGPEMLDLPVGARVSPLDKIAGTTFGPRAFEGAMILDDYGVDQLMDRVMDRLSMMGVS